MKNRLLFSTALVAASVSFAGLANAGVVTSIDQLTSEDPETAKVLDGNWSSELATAELQNDVVVNGQFTLNDKVVMTGGKDFTVNGNLTETEAGSDLSGVNVTAQRLMIGNDLTVGNMSVGTEGGFIGLYLTNEDQGDGEHQHGQYANNPAKTLTVNGTLTTTADLLVAKVDQGVEEDKFVESNENGYASLTLNGNGKIVNDHTLALWRTTNLDLDVEGEGTIEVTAKPNNIDGLTLASGKTIANNVVVGENKNFTNNGTVTGIISNSGTVETSFAGIEAGFDPEGDTPKIFNNVDATLILNNGGTLKDGIINNAGIIQLNGDFTTNEEVNLYNTHDTGKIFVNNNLSLGDKGGILAADMTIGDNATLDLGNGWVAPNNILFASTSTLALNIGMEDDEIIGGYLEAWNDATIEEGATLKPTIASGIEGEYQFMEADNIDGEWTLASNSLYNVELNGEQDTLLISKKASSEIAENTGADANQAAAISAVIDGADTNNAAFNAVANNINDMLQSGDATQVQAALDMVTAMSPETAPAAQTVASENVSQVFSAIGTRMSGGAVASANQGMSSGDSLFEKGAAWVQGLFNHAKLDKTANNAGFKADTAGIALGFEKEVNDTTKAGLGYAYNQSDIKGNLRKTDVDTHTAFVYGEYKPAAWFVNGMLSRNWSSYDEKTAVAKAKYDAETLAMQTMFGYNMLAGSVTLTPQAGLRYVHIDQESYTNNLGINVGGDKSDILTGVLGATVAQNWNLDNGMVLKPEARLAFTYDMKNDAANATVALPNGSSYTVEGKALKKFGVEAGLGLTASINDHVDLTFGYEGKFRDDYRDHTGLLNLKYKF